MSVRPAGKFDRTLQYFRSPHTELTSLLGFSLLSEVLQSAHAQRATLANQTWRLQAELPRIHATTPLPYQNLHFFW